MKQFKKYRLVRIHDGAQMVAALALGMHGELQEL